MLEQQLCARQHRCQSVLVNDLRSAEAARRSAVTVTLSGYTQYGYIVRLSIAYADLGLESGSSVTVTEKGRQVRFVLSLDHTAGTPKDE